MTRKSLNGFNRIRLSPKYGVNPTIPVCFWCGKERNEVALLGYMGDSSGYEDIEALLHSVIDFEPCDECRRGMSIGFTLMEVTHNPNYRTSVPVRDGVYLTGAYVVVNPDVVKMVFGDESASAGGKAFLASDVFQSMFAEVANRD